LSYPEYAKAGAIPNETIVLQPGPLQFSGTMLEHLRKLGLVVEIDNGTLELRSSFVACKTGIPLSPEQAKLLVHLEKPLIEFKIKVESFWVDGKVEEY